MRMRIGLRAKAYLLIVPLVMAVVLVSGVLASLEARAGLTDVATRLLAYKAEQLRDYAYSEWDVIEELGLAGLPEYRDVVEASIGSYATSLLRSESEQILALDSDGRVVMSVGLSQPGGDDIHAERLVDPPAPGWFEREILDDDRVGVAFDFEPFEWRMAVTDLESSFFAEVYDIGRTHVAILAVALAVVITMLSVFVGYIIRPVEQLTLTIDTVSVSNDLSHRVDPGYPDELGLLAADFNRMLDSLEASYRQLQEKTEAEVEARRIAVDREEETLFLLGRVSEFRDMETGEHLSRVATLCSILAEMLGWSRREQTLIYRSSQLHDIGKIAIPDAILQKPGTLTEDEFNHMKLHTTIGHNLLKDAKSEHLLHAADIALTHHERWDGTGYPSGLAGDDIPLSGRIVGIVDVFDALTSDRHYKRAWSTDEALDHIGSHKSKHFDPKLVDIFTANFDELRTAIRR